MADRTPRRKTVSVAFADNGDMLTSLYTAPDADGKQSVAEVLTVPFSAIHPSLVAPFTLRGVADTLRNIINRLDNPSAEQAHAEYVKFLATVTDGSWTPGRTAGEGEPDDIVLALAEVTGQPTFLIQNKLDEMLAEPKRNNAGEVMHDARGRAMHIWSKARLYTAMENSDPRVKIALSKIVAERAKRLAAEAKSAKPVGTSLGDLFGTPSPQPAAAN